MFGEALASLVYWALGITGILIAIHYGPYIIYGIYLLVYLVGYTLLRMLIAPFTFARFYKLVMREFRERRAI